MIITAKFASTCSCCSQRIAVGSKIEWTKGTPAKHVSCSAPSAGAVPVASTVSTVRAARARRPGRWTGCSCGSREDSSGALIAAAHNCKSCNFDGFDC